MSDKTVMNPFASALETGENNQLKTSEQAVNSTNFSTKDRSTETNVKTEINSEHGTIKCDSPLGLVDPGIEAGSTAAEARRPPDSAGLNPFLAVDTSPAIGLGLKLEVDREEEGVSIDSTYQQSEESKDVDGYQEFSFGPQLPKVNCKEKIVICFDLSSEVDRVPFIGRDGTPYNSSVLLQSVLNFFIQTKNSMNPQHEFALVVLQEKAIWYQDFTNECNDVIRDLYDLNSVKPDCEEFDLTSLFEILHENVTLPTVDGDVECLPPPYIVRTIMVYGRSKCIPTFTANREVCEHFLKSPYFFMDVFYIHEAPTDENSCKEVYDVFLDLDEVNRAYINEVGRNITQLYDKMAMFLAHPLQRPYQQHCEYTLKETSEEI